MPDAGSPKFIHFGRLTRRNFGIVEDRSGIDKSLVKRLYSTRLVSIIGSSEFIMRSRVQIVFLASSLALSSFPACKQGSPTSPDSTHSLNIPPLSPPPPPQYCPPPSQLPVPSPGALSFLGSISAGGEKLSSVCVYLSWDASQSTGTIADGKFGFSGFPGSHFIITPSLVNHAFFPASYELGTQSRDDLDFIVQPASYGSMIGDIAADFSLPNQVGRNSSLYAYFGQVVLLNISADWCSSCREEAGHLDKLFQNYRERGLQIIMVLADGDPAAWARGFELTFPVLKDEHGYVYNTYFTGELPVNVVLDRNMTIRAILGDYDEAAFLAAITKYL